MRVAVLVDAAFFLRRYNKLVAGGKTHPPTQVADTLHAWACQHVQYEAPGRGASANELYRIFVYDCPPFVGGVHHPVTGEFIKFGETPFAQFRLNFHQRLRQLRKVAVRLGKLSDMRTWTIRPEVQLDLLKGRRDAASLTEEDVRLDIKQKGVDMRIGVDVASISFKKQADRIILIAGDADFVPAAKLARREGLDFVLDSMHAPIGADLYEHIDGLVSRAPAPAASGTVSAPFKEYSVVLTPASAQVDKSPFYFSSFRRWLSDTPRDQEAADAALRAMDDLLRKRSSSRNPPSSPLPPPSPDASEGAKD